MSTKATDSQTLNSCGDDSLRSKTSSWITLSLRMIISFEVSDSRKFNLTSDRV